MPQQRGFLSGAAETALGVAGGVLLGNLIAGAFSGGGQATAAEQEPADADADADANEPGDGGDFGDGGFDAGDF
jgi:hypothetical protein